MRALRFWAVTVTAAGAAAATLALGFWQWDRAQQKLALQAAIEQRRALPPLDEDVLVSPRADDGLLHRQILLRGQWVAARTVYLDNRQMNGRPGFFVVTPLKLAAAQPGDPVQAILVQRGWVPRNFTDRTRLPPLETPAGEVLVRGRLSPPPARLYEFDAAEQGPIRQNLDLARFGAETGLALHPLSLQQLGAPSEGLLREWPQPASGAEKNYGYAFQWWALSGLIAVLYVWFQFFRPRRRARAA